MYRFLLNRYGILGQVKWRQSPLTLRFHINWMGQMGKKFSWTSLNLRFVESLCYMFRLLLL
jgi:hypothetical protein